MDTRKNAPLTAKGREMMVRAVVDSGCPRPPPRPSSTRRRRPSPNGSSGSRPRAWRACATVRQGPTHRQAKQRLPSARRSRLCESSATPASRSPPRSTFRPPTSAAFSSGSASTGSRRSGRPSRFAAMNGPLQARSSTSTSRSSANSVGSVTGSPATAPARATPAGSAGNTCIWRSTTLRASPTWEILPDEKRASCLRFLFNALRFSFEASASRSSAS